MLVRIPRYTDVMYYLIFHSESGKTVKNRCVASSFLINSLRTIDLNQQVNIGLEFIRRNNYTIKSKDSDSNFVQITYTKPRGKVVTKMTWAIIKVNKDGTIDCTTKAKEAGVLDWVWTVPKTNQVDKTEEEIES